MFGEAFIGVLNPLDFLLEIYLFVVLWPDIRIIILVITKADDEAVGNFHASNFFKVQLTLIAI